MGVSVLIITKNRPNLLELCLNSIVRQSYLPDEVVIIDSSDTSVHYLTRKFVKKLHIVYRYRPTLTIPEARNYCIELASQNRLLFIDDDCTAERKWIEKMVALQEKNPHAMLISGKLIHVPQKSMYSVIIRTIRAHRIKIADQNQRGMYFNVENCIFKKSTFKKYSIHFDRKMIHEEFADLALQIMGKNGEILTERNTIVYHYGRQSLLEFLHQRFKNAGNAIRLNSKWRGNIFYFYGSKRFQYIFPFIEIIKDFNRQRKFLHIIKFISVSFFSILSYELGYWHCKLTYKHVA